MIYSGWDSIFHTLVVGVLAYVALVVFLRLSGKRTLAKLNAFDLIVTVALGSLLATVVMGTEVALARGVFAFLLLIGLQFAVTWSSVRVRWLRRMVTGDPVMLLYRGEFLPAALQQERVTEGEIRAAIRAARVDSLDKVHAVVLETDGSISVVLFGEAGDGSSLAGVAGLQEARQAQEAREAAER